MQDNPIIVALDCDAEQAMTLAASLQGEVQWVKVGMTLFYAEGPSIVARLHSMGFQVFVDLKLHDIPHQVAGAAAQLARTGAGMITVHASGGSAMMRAAVESSRGAAADAGLPAPSVLAVTVLTSVDEVGLEEVGIRRAAADQVTLLARVAADAGADGVVCSPREAARMRELLGDCALVVTPGVRPEGSEPGDQARVATPSAALAAGASHLVIGRPITSAASPVESVARIVAEIAEYRAHGGAR